MRTYVWMLMAAAVLTGACAAGGADVAKEKTAILAADREWSQSTKDADKFVSFYAADASTYPPNTAKVSGPGNIKKMYTEMMGMPGFSLQWAPDIAEVSASGDLGYTIGTYTMSSNNPAGSPVTDKGKYITLWKKQTDGAWKVAGDMFNSDMPPPSEAAAPTSAGDPSKK